MDIAEALLAVGAEVNRVEDTLTRMGTAYGAVRMNAFVITSSIVVTMPLPSGRDITQTRRILTPGGTDFTVLEALNDLSRRCCADPIPLDELRREVAQITAVAPKPLLVYLGSALAAGSCALFFGGSMTDGLVAVASSGILALSAPTAWYSTCSPLWLLASALPCAPFSCRSSTPTKS